MANTIPGIGVLENPSASPVPASQTWIGATSLTGTLNSTTSVTALASTNGLAVGQPVSGTGIPTGTYITAINSATAITISQPATVSSSQTLTFAIFDPVQSNWAAASPFYPLPPAGSQTVDCYIETPNLQSIAAGANYVLPPMFGGVSVTLGSGTIAQYQMLQASGAGSAWNTIGNVLAANTTSYVGGVLSDGVNFRFASSGGVSVITTVQFA